MFCNWAIPFRLWRVNLKSFLIFYLCISSLFKTFFYFSILFPIYHWWFLYFKEYRFLPKLICTSQCLLKHFCHQILCLTFPLELLFFFFWYISVSSWVHFQIFLSKVIAVVLLGPWTLENFPCPGTWMAWLGQTPILLNYRPCSAVLQVINETEKKPNVNIIFILYGIFFFFSAWTLEGLKTLFLGIYNLH